ncbi:hypothetical protein [Pusillimonas sp.]|uniref:hypothetical protein n=1 Tax=Pusillimonas sp. TaxID=3040095 RepID=UPI0029AA0AB5|nr:hypothetical protein [Pusillimonas sp.]MDX3893876.1 hypothetical protein [Pusillimonas sp.]
MSSLARRIQGHYYGVEADRSTILQFKQLVGDFDTLGNVVYCLVSLAALAGAALLAIATDLHEAAAVLLVIVLGISTIVLRIKIFNRYAFSVQRISVSSQGDLEWPGGWMAHEAIEDVAARRTGSTARGYTIVCLDRSGDSHDLGTGLTRAGAEAICRDLRTALKNSSFDAHARAHEPPLKNALAGSRG